MKAVGGGDAIISVNASGHTAQCAVVVSVPVNSICLNTTSVSLKQNQTTQLTATVGPDDATDKTVTWSSSDTLIASVDSSGTVRAIQEGYATITAKAGDKQATCAVIVSNNGSGSHEGTGEEEWN